MRRIAAGVSVLLGMVLAMLGPAAALAGQDQKLYLEGDDVPTASMTTNTPPAQTLPNFDPDRDDEPGLLLQKSALGRLEIDHTKYQQWEHDMSGQTVSVTEFVIWAAVKDFDEEKTGRFGVYVMDCGLICIPLDSATGAVTGGETWKRIDLGLSIRDHYFGPGQDLVVKVVVLNGSEDDMWFAYATAKYPAHLVIDAAQAATTTTTTSTTSTTTPPTTTTTTVPTPTTTAPVTTSSTTSPDTTTTTTPAIDDGPPPAIREDDPPIDEGEPISGPQTTTTTATTTPQESDDRDTDQPTAASSTGSGTPPQREVVIFSKDGSTSRPGEIFASTGRLDPQEGLMVAFSTMAESIDLQWQAAVGLGSLAALLAWIGLSRRDEDEYWLSVEESVG